MDSNSTPVEMFFFPFVGGGHQIPMIDMARVFARHGAKTTIIATPKHALSFQNSVERDQISGLPISIHVLNLQDNVDIANTDMSAGPFTDTSMLQEPLQNLLLEYRPDCIVHDLFHRWSANAIDSLGVTRITFNGHGCFSPCVIENITRHKPHEKMGSDFESFVVPALPDRIELTRSQLPPFLTQHQDYGGVPKGMIKPDGNSFGAMVNSFYELEPAYVEYFKNEMGRKAWLVGPVSLCNRNVEDKAERGQNTSLDGQSILSWLDSKEANSVLYISFGSKAHFAPEQLVEIAHGLEAANHPFIWAVGKSHEKWLPGGFEDRIQESERGLIIKGWAPQLLILEHGVVGGFMTHCGWNSTLEGVTAGVPMITWPLSAEQFFNEKFITDVLKIGVKVGSIQWQSEKMQPGRTVGREKVETAVKRLMGSGKEAAEMKRRAKVLAGKARRSVEEGGSSFNDADALIRELKSRSKTD